MGVAVRLAKRMSKKELQRLARKARIRKRIEGTPERPRLVVYRSSQYIYAQIIDDVSQRTLAAAASTEKDIKSKLKSSRNLEASKAVGKEIAVRAQAQKITTVVFDRSGFVYHGRIKAVADAAREAGLKF